MGFLYIIYMNMEFLSLSETHHRYSDNPIRRFILCTVPPARLAAALSFHRHVDILTPPMDHGWIVAQACSHARTQVYIYICVCGCVYPAAPEGSET